MFQFPGQKQPTQQQGRPRRALAAALLASTILAGGGFAGYALAADNTPAPTPAATAPLSATPAYGQTGFADLVDKVKPAVVNISVTEKPAQSDDDQDGQQSPQFNFPPNSPMGQMFKHFFDQQQQQGSEARHAMGSGFIIDPTGYIVTNNHVVDGATKITVTMVDGTTYPATVKGRDTKTDVALIKIDAPKPLPYVQFGNSDKTRIGDWVIAIGNPFGLGGTVTAGILSAHDRNINQGPYDDFLQIDAPINPGNSGGPLFNQAGQVIGIDSAIYSPNGGSVGIGFAIPSNLASQVIDQLKSTGTVARGYIGVQMQPMSPTLAKSMGLANTDGVLVDKVEPNSPADLAKIAPGDVITAFNGVPIKSTRDLAVAVADVPAGKSAGMSVWRDGHDQTINLTVGTQPTEKVASADKTGNQEQVGMALAPLTSQDRQALGLDDSSKGVVVSRVAPNSKAAESGVQPGDVIVRVGNDQVNTPAEASAKIHQAMEDKKDALPLLVTRQGTTYYLALQLAAG